MQEARPIVVGVDGTDGGRRALQFAYAEARLRGCPVHVVHVLRQAGTDEVELPSQSEGRQQGVAVTTEVVTGDPAEVLIDRSAEADLLVIGSHGTSSLIRSALGSVSNACAQLARCPVVVLPHGSGADHQPRSEDS